MTIPKNVWWFEVLLYASLILDALSVAFQDRTPRADMTEQMISVATIMAAVLILLLVFFVWLAAHRRKNWPRWALTAALVLSSISLTQVIGEKGLQFDSFVDIISCGLTLGGLYCSFTGDAKGWFNA
jgi:drug/metabolite transporter (DMT)-like permease